MYPRKEQSGKHERQKKKKGRKNVLLLLAGGGQFVSFFGMYLLSYDGFPWVRTGNNIMVFTSMLGCVLSAILLGLYAGSDMES